MTQATLSAKHEAPARQYLSAEQELSLVAQVKERTELLKRKQDNFTLEEHRIRIRGERAFNTLLEDYQGVMWRLVMRYSFLNRLTLDEMYQIAMVAVERAVSTHDPNRAGKQRKFSSWVFLKISSRFYFFVLKISSRLSVFIEPSWFIPGSFERPMKGQGIASNRESIGCQTRCQRSTLKRSCLRRLSLR